VGEKKLDPHDPAIAQKRPHYENCEHRVRNKAEDQLVGTITSVESLSLAEVIVQKNAQVNDPEPCFIQNMGRYNSCRDKWQSLGRNSDNLKYANLHVAHGLDWHTRQVIRLLVNGQREIRCVLPPSLARSPSETSAYFNETKRHYIPEGGHLHPWTSENVRSAASFPDEKYAKNAACLMNNTRRNGG
jgi:hypothetical protein